MAVLDYHEEFATVYESFYSDRDVTAECEVLLERLKLQNSAPRSSRVLDIGCGCGNHLIQLSTLGYCTTGIDISDSMIERARHNAEGAAIELICGDPVVELSRFDEGRRFDAAYSLFQVVNCLPSAGAMRDWIRSIRKAIVKGGRFYIETWNGAAVMVQEPRSETRTFSHVRDPNLVIERTIKPSVDRVNQRCELVYKIRVIDKTCGAETQTFDSVHSIHFLTPPHYRDLFESAGFAISDEFARDRHPAPLSTDDWYAGYILEAV